MINKQITKTIKILENLGLKNIATPKQNKNGTIYVYDPLTNVKYGIYASGYIRRIYRPGICQYRHTNMNVEWCYQLNKIDSHGNRIIHPNDYPKLTLHLITLIKKFRKNYA